ncbi:SNF2-related protein [Myxococcus sp. CA040A]|uniref:SNF2-related protein n=1 Tax=Myxococcus sp. CA040A TaxID=2741738 RepID=UPI001C2D5161|nr:SNF2-related protein [Myxococcus sp. CA040A]NTX01947.1 DEAD/DEAH box helicase family protein [Myxococcus sp. CA040A]
MLRQVAFPEGSQYVPEDQLEAVDEVPKDPLDVFESGHFSSVHELGRALVRARLTGRLANVLYSLDATNSDFYAYQFKPVVKLLQSPTTGILIADEVGLGKTIEAGLIWTEFRSRFDARRLLVVCPSVLRTKWKDELARRFGVQAEVLGARETLSRMKEALDSGHAGEFAIIASLQGIRPLRGWEDTDTEGGASELARFLQENQEGTRLIDVLVIDEAHYLRNPASQSAEVARLLRRVSEYIVLLSATPIHLKNEDLFQLLTLIDEDTFHQPAVFEQQLKANAPLIRARDRLLTGRCTPTELAELLRTALAHPVLKTSRQLAGLLKEAQTTSTAFDRETVSRLAQRLESVNLLGHAVTRTRKRDVTEWRVIREPRDQAIHLTEVERSFYDIVTETVREYCIKAGGHEGFLLVTPQRQMSSSMPAALRAWQKRGADDALLLTQDLGIDVETDDSGGPLVQQLVANASKLGNLKQLWESDSKYHRFSTELGEYLKSHPTERVVVFAYFRPTLEYLHERLTGENITAVLLYGGSDKDEVLARFGKQDGPRVLLSSEVGSEGVDLQFCRLLINYDLPWNPMRLEQRIGRLDRLGQKSERIVVWNLFYDDTIDSRIYERLYRRLAIAEASLGSLEPILAEHIQDLTLELLSRKLTPEEEEARIEQTAQAIANRRQQEDDLEKEAAHLVQYGDYILQHISAARETGRRITGEDVRDFVVGFFTLHYAGSQFRQIGGDACVMEVSLSSQAKFDLENFLRNTKARAATSLIRNDPRPVTCRFDNRIVGANSHSHETIGQMHPVVRFAVRRERDLGVDSQPAVCLQLDAARDEKGVAPGLYAFSTQLWSVRGVQEIEQLHYAVERLDGTFPLVSPQEAERIVVIATQHGRNWRGATDDLISRAAHCINNVCLERCDEQYEKFVGELQLQNIDRADAQEHTLELHLEGQMRRLGATYEKHRLAGRTGLARATETRIAMIKARVERQRLAISERRELKHFKTDLCVGLLEVIGR